MSLQEYSSCQVCTSFFIAGALKKYHFCELHRICDRVEQIRRLLVAAAAIFCFLRIEKRMNLLINVVNHRVATSRPV